MYPASTTHYSDDLRKHDTSNGKIHTSNDRISANASAITSKTKKSSASLDLYSISQTSSDVDMLSREKCQFFAPLFAVPITPKSYYIVQGNCHNWTCARCGIIRAKQEYWRIINGCRTLAVNHNTLWMITLTCRGKEMPLQTANDNYLQWTNRLLTAMRTRYKRDQRSWHYVQVTERQQRQHPHSHLIMTSAPHDTKTYVTREWKKTNIGYELVKVTKARSQWLIERAVSAGLGNQCDIQPIRTIEGASRYVAKYLFKDSIFQDIWPKNWKRIRYSQSWPKKQKGKSDAIALIKNEDWKRLARLAVSLTCEDEYTYNESFRMLYDADILIKTPNQK